MAESFLSPLWGLRWHLPASQRRPANRRGPWGLVLGPGPCCALDQAAPPLVTVVGRGNRQPAGKDSIVASVG
jgi:hypothetical protein